MQKVIIVGATSGIGQTLARIYAANGCLVGITGRRNHLLDALYHESPGQYVTKRFDVTQTESVAEHLDELSAEMGGLDVMVISAGSGEVNTNLDFGVEKQMIDLNVRGFTAVADWSFKYFMQQGNGHLAAISSIAGLRGSRQSPGYSATKAYQINYLQGLRQNAHHTKVAIAVTDIRPGFVDTPTSNSPVKFWVVPVEKAARQIFYSIRNKRKVVYISRRWTIIAKFFRWLPGWIHERL